MININVCKICNREFDNKRSLVAHKIWHRPGYRKSRSGVNHPMYGKFGIDHPKFNGGNSYYYYLHFEAHIVDPKPADGICNICHQKTDKKGITKLEHSNKDHSYRLPINPDEWQWVHRSCHKVYDIENK